MHDDALSLLGDSVKNFKEERLNARKLVVDHVGEENYHEQRYEALCENWV